jgi:heme/copper-type cytochrome/quinol oxidase subunit 4
MGIGLAILLIFVILGGFFVDPSKDQGWIKWVLIGVTALIIIFVVVGALRGFGFGLGFGGAGFLYGIPWGTVILVVIVVGAIIWVIKGTNTNN